MTRDKDAEAAAHALDADSAEERAAFDDALTSDASLRRKQAEFDDVARELADATAPVAPPDGMKSRLMSAISDLPQHTPEPAADVPLEAGPTAEPQHGAHGHDSSSVATPMTPAEKRAQRRWYTRPATIAVAAVAASALIFAGGTLIGTVVTNDSVTAQSEAADKLAAINAADDTQSTSVESGGTSATVVWSESLGLSAVVMQGLPDAPDGKVYEAWYIDDSGAVAAGTFVANTNETTWHVLDGAFSPGTVIGITVEPQGGSDQPTSDPIMVFETA
ncbi:anti-sigma factor [Paramicrobacterium chengjingii]|uniref:Regulator of SigK n=1 Tax=Paramicrobacterium chengjingii TaxID=2769067 RepID=A0ABX6YGT7_9MICO|nr:anti-sigma factor [Microbacterium chengjingii]QPZ38008.1 anti-sigma factor [Microbacterium chengjingii]